MWKILQHLISTEYNVCKTTSTHNLRNLSHFSFHVKHHLPDIISSFPPTGPKQTFATFHELVEFKGYQTSRGYWPMSFRAQGFLHTVPEEKKTQRNRSSREINCIPKDLFLFLLPITVSYPQSQKSGMWFDSWARTSTDGKRDVCVTTTRKIMETSKWCPLAFTP